MGIREQTRDKIMSELNSATIDRPKDERAILEHARAREAELLADDWLLGENFLPRGLDGGGGTMRQVARPTNEEQLAALIKELEDKGFQVEVVPGVNKVRINRQDEAQERALELRETGYQSPVSINDFRPGFTLCGDGDPENGAFLYKKPIAEQPASAN